jgi:hypothetical protein
LVLCLQLVSAVIELVQKNGTGLFIGEAIQTVPPLTIVERLGKVAVFNEVMSNPVGFGVEAAIEAIFPGGCKGVALEEVRDMIESDCALMVVMRLGAKFLPDARRGAPCVVLTVEEVGEIVTVSKREYAGRDGDACVAPAGDALHAAGVFGVMTCNGQEVLQVGNSWQGDSVWLVSVEVAKHLKWKLVRPRGVHIGLPEGAAGVGLDQCMVGADLPVAGHGIEMREVDENLRVFRA